MPAGLLYRRIVIQRAADAQNQETGGIELGFVDWIKRWAWRRDPRGSEQLQAQGQVVAQAECVYEIREDSDTRTITAAQNYRVVDGARCYDIVSVTPSLRRSWMLQLLVRTRGEVAA